MGDFSINFGFLLKNEVFSYGIDSIIFVDCNKLIMTRFELVGVGKSRKRHAT